VINDELIIRANNKHRGNRYHNIVMISLDDYHSTNHDTPPCAENLASHHRMNFCDEDLSPSG
jgi:uridine kinase